MNGPARIEPTHRADVVVVGDGPAGSALAAACRRLGVDVLLVGDSAPWPATYGVWLDEIEEVGGFGDATDVARDVGPMVAHGDEPHELDRRYGVVDNDALRRRLQSGVVRLAGRASSIRTGVTHHNVELPDGRCIRCRLVVRATGSAGQDGGRNGGRAGRPPAWQTALGVVLADPPGGDLGRATFMDFRPLPGEHRIDAGSPTFAYALPVADGWLVEETVLAARPAIDPATLRPALAARLRMPPEELAERTVRTEVVAIPMGGGPHPDRQQPVVAFGAAAGYVHPATGFSLSASLRAAPRVAEAIGASLETAGDLAADPRPVWEAVWPTPARRTRILHEYGLERMLALDPPDVRRFFDRFFELPTEVWAAYLRVDAAPGEVSRAMSRLFRSSSWSLRRRLAAGNPLELAPLLRP